MVSFGNASGPLKNIDVQKHIQPKSLFFTRPTGGHYFITKQLFKEMLIITVEPVETTLITMVKKTILRVKEMQSIY